MATSQNKGPRARQPMPKRTPTTSAVGLDCPAALIDDAVRDKCLRRLRKVEGQIRGIQQMIEAGRPCPQVLEQLAAAQSAMRAVGREVLRDHMHHCASETLRSGPAHKATEVYDELITLMYRNAR